MFAESACQLDEFQEFAETYEKAEDEYRAGRATKSTARTFHAAGALLEVNKMFAGDDPKESRFQFEPL